MSRLLAFGDVHGCSMHLDALLAAIQPTTADRLVFLGDLVDRGPDTWGVLNRVLDLKTRLDVTCIRGNHELQMHRARTDASERKFWMRVGGSETLASYSPIPGRLAPLTGIPDPHWDFVEKGCVDFLETDTAVFVHAGYDPDHAPDEQPEEVLFWEPIAGPIRHPSGKPIICGHTDQRSGNIWDLGSTICIDTAAYKGGKLTCLDVSTWHFWQADLLGRVSEGNMPER